MSRPELSQPKDWVGKMLRTALLAVAIFELLAVQTSGLAGADFDGQALQGKIRGDSGILPLQHKYAQMNGSSFHNGGRHMTREHYELLKRHDRRRARRFLSSIANFPLRGQADPDAQGYRDYLCFFCLFFLPLSLGFISSLGDACTNVAVKIQS